MPHRIVNRRAPSPDVLCGRYDPFLEGYCAAPVQLVVTRSPLTGEVWHHLIVTRCTSGHIHSVRGVIPEPIPEWVDDAWGDDDGAIGL